MAETDPGKFNSLAEQLAKPRFKDKAIELYYNMMLSGPATHVVNVTSNTLTALGQLPEHGAAAVIGKTRELVNRGAIDRVTGSEVGQRAFGLMQGFKEGLRQFARTARTGDTSDLVSKVEAQHQKAISGLKGEVIRTPSRLLSAEDELFKAVARRMELNGQGDGPLARLGVSNVADQILRPEAVQVNFSSYGWAKFSQHAHAMAAGYADAAPGPKLYFFCLAIELGLKAAIYAKSPSPATKGQLKRIGHNLVALLERFEDDWAVGLLNAQQIDHLARINRYFEHKGLEYYTGEMLEAILKGWGDLPDPIELEGVAATINAFLAGHDYFIEA